MYKDNNDIEQILAKTSFRELTHEEQNHVWSRIGSRKHSKTLLLNKHSIMYKTLIITLILVLGVGATVVTADNSAPGDTLFGVKLATENVKISLAGKTKKDQLRIKFADERVKELDHITAKVDANSTTNVGTLSSTDKVKVTVGINAALALLNNVSTSVSVEDAARLKLITDQLNAYLATVPKDSTVDIKVEKHGDKEESKVDISTIDGRVHIQIKGEDDNEQSDDRRSSVSGSGRDGEESDDEENDDDSDGIKLPPVVVTPPTGTTLTAYTLADVKLHNTSTNCWTTINGSVYNVTSWIGQHPGGSAAIISLCGIDGSSAFNGQHGVQARPASELASFKIGVLK